MSTKRFLNGELIEVADGDEVIQIARMETYDGSKLICRVDKDFAELQSNVRVNLHRKFYALPVAERKEIMEDRADVGGALVVIHIEEMLKSKFEKERSYTVASELFMKPKE